MIERNEKESPLPGKDTHFTAPVIFLFRGVRTTSFLISLVLVFPLASQTLLLFLCIFQAQS